MVNLKKWYSLPVYVRERIAAIKALTNIPKNERNRLISETLAEHEKNKAVNV